MKHEMDVSDARARELCLTEEEVAFYDAVAENAESVYDEVLSRPGPRRRREADFEPFIARFIQQAKAQYAEWRLVA
jgi:hypothetical protein